ncbi:unnamed protein product, partial [Owenia fusiformis]
RKTEYYFKELPRREEMLKKAKKIASKLTLLNQSFGNLHRMVGHSRHIEEWEFDIIDECVKDYCQTFRKLFPYESNPLKFHFIEDHLEPFIRKMKCGLGVLGEQGIEGLHKQFNELGVRFRRTKNTLSRLCRKNGSDGCSMGFAMLWFCCYLVKSWV